jgi:hypothetical protein
VLRAPSDCTEADENRRRIERMVVKRLRVEATILKRVQEIS